MKKIALVSLALILCLGLSAKKEKPMPKVILIGIGEKNPTFDESRYPHIEFYYTPNLVFEKQTGNGTKAASVLGSVAGDILTGTPEFLVEVASEHALTNCFFLFDKNGVCYSHGYELGRRGHYLKTVGIDGNALEDTFKETVEKGKEAKVAKKEMKMQKSDFMMGREFPDFSIISVDGTKVSMTSLTKAGEPIFITFFSLDSDIDILEMYESGEGKTSKEYGKAVLSGVQGANVTGLCERIEKDFFSYDARVE